MKKISCLKHNFFQKEGTNEHRSSENIFNKNMFYLINNTNQCVIKSILFDKVNIISLQT